jgi:hypothetical protein
VEARVAHRVLVHHVPAHRALEHRAQEHHVLDPHARQLRVQAHRDPEHEPKDLVQKDHAPVHHVHPHGQAMDVRRAKRERGRKEGLRGPVLKNRGQDLARQGKSDPVVDRMSADLVGQRVVDDRLASRSGRGLRKSGRAVESRINAVLHRED